MNKRDNAVLVIDSATSEISLEITEVEYSEWLPAGLAWSPDGEFLAVGVYQNVRIWDTIAGEQIQTINDERLRGAVIEWSLDGTHLLTLCSQFTDEMDVISIDACEWDYSTGTQVHSLELGSSLFFFISEAVWSPDQSQLTYIVGGRGRGIYGDPIYVKGYNDQEERHLDSGYMIAWKSGTILTIADLDGRLRNYSVATGEILAEHNLHTPSLTSIAFSSNGMWIAATGLGMYFPVNIWDIRDNLGFADRPLYTFCMELAETVMWTPDGNSIVTFGSNHGDTVLWYQAWKINVVTDESIDLYQFYSQYETLPELGWNSDFTQLAQSTDENTVAISEGVTITVRGEYVQGIIWSPDDSMIATISRDIDSDIPIIEIWNVETGSRIGSVEYHAQFHQLLWSPNSDSFAVVGIHMGEYGTYFVEIYDDHANITPFELVIESSWLPAIAWNNDSNLIAVWAEQEVSINDVGSNEIILTIPAYRIRTLSWHPDDTLLAGGSADGTIRIWDVSDITRTE